MILKRCIKFLESNGWAANYEPENEDEFLSLMKDECIGIDINKYEIVLIDGTGDFLHLPLNYYALVGALIEYRQIAINYTPILFAYNSAD